ncbi:hypothetical protein C8J57DRAFT_693363 [Mycena rebaudengoi]|nr:hypothetical protein C8J57DRAFT_693363 [Mycena rebaudengoi]
MSVQVQTLVVPPHRKRTASFSVAPSSANSLNSMNGQGGRPAKRPATYRVVPRLVFCLLRRLFILEHQHHESDHPADALEFCRWGRGRRQGPPAGAVQPHAALLQGPAGRTQAGGRLHEHRHHVILHHPAAPAPHPPSRRTRPPRHSRRTRKRKPTLRRPVLLPCARLSPLTLSCSRHPSPRTRYHPPTTRPVALEALLPPAPRTLSMPPHPHPHPHPAHPPPPRAKSLKQTSRPSCGAPSPPPTPRTPPRTPSRRRTCSRSDSTVLAATRCPRGAPGRGRRRASYRWT